MIEVATPPADDLALTLVHLLSKIEVQPEKQTILLEELIPYLVARDHKILAYGYDAGRASA
jgi:hypothetical protein